MSWAALIKKVRQEVDPLRCPACGGTMKIVSFIDKCQPEVVEKILRHCGPSMIGLLPGSTAIWARYMLFLKSCLIFRLEQANFQTGQKR